MGSLLLDRLARLLPVALLPDADQYEIDSCATELKRWLNVADLQPVEVMLNQIVHNFDDQVARIRERRHAGKACALDAQVLVMGRLGALYRTGAIHIMGLDRLARCAFLNDDVVDWCMLEMFARSPLKGTAQMRVHFETARLNGTLRQDNSESLRRAHKTLPYDMMLCDTLLMPENDHLHWWLWVIDLKNKRLFVLDPLSHNPMALTGAVVRWLTNEYERRGFHHTHVNTWPCKSIRGQQGNNYDCGVFVIAYAKCIACKVPILDVVGTVTQKMVSSIRARILADAIEIVNFY